MAIGRSLADRSPFFHRIRSMIVWSVLLYLRFFARLALSRTRATRIGIAGSVGKSTARNALSSILAAEGNTHVVSGNSETGIPLGLLRLSPGNFTFADWVRILLSSPFRIHTLKNAEYLIIEMGIDGPHPPKSMAYLLTIVKPDIAILLNETPAHVGNYKSILSKGTPSSDRGKLDRIVRFMTEDDGKIITDSGCKTAIINADDPRITRYLQPRIPSGCTLRTFGASAQNDVSYASGSSDSRSPRHTPYTVSPDGTVFGFRSKDGCLLALTLPRYCLPQATQSVFAAALLAANAVGIGMGTAAKRIESDFRLPPGRASFLRGINNSTIIDSSYNASGASVIAFLDMVKALKQSHKGPAAFLFGDMLELGDLTEIEHNRVAKHMKGIVDELYLVGPITHKLKHIFVPCVPFILSFSTSLEAGSYLQKHLKKNTLLLVKGSQFLEEAIKLILRHSEDRKALCRQDSYWEGLKKQKSVWAEPS